MFFCFYVFLNDLEFSRDFFQVFRTKTLASEGKLQKKNISGTLIADSKVPFLHGALIARRGTILVFVFVFV